MSLCSRCCVPGCHESKNSHKVLHGFPNPTRDAERFRSWVYAIGGDILGLDNLYIHKYRRVCHNHFEEKYLCRYNRISNVALPTLNLPGPLALQKFNLEHIHRTYKPIENLALPSTTRDPVNFETLPQTIPSVAQLETPLFQEKENVLENLVSTSASELREHNTSPAIEAISATSNTTNIITDDFTSASELREHNKSPAIEAVSATPNTTNIITDGKMSQTVEVKDIIKTLISGSSSQHFCIVCFQSVEGSISENVLTIICNEDEEFSVAQLLKNICNAELSLTSNDRICLKCLKLATATYKFYKLVNDGKKIWDFYVTELMSQVPIYKCDMSNPTIVVLPDILKANKNVDPEIKQNIKDNVKSILKVNGSLYKSEKSSAVKSVVQRKQRRSWKRKPMISEQCVNCPAKYRFLGKLKEHMRIEHGTDIHICKICNACIEDENEYKFHIQTHTNLYICDICSMTFRGRNGVINHLKWHENIKELIKTDQGYICEICGLIFESDNTLEEHNLTSHVKNYTCFYCGKMYKGEVSFDAHIRKHEFYMNNINPKDKVLDVRKHGKRNSFTCCQCGKSFKHERTLMFHERLHTNERPYVCELCGRNFVSINRRNQHALCAHTAPTRRCPLCPALFHLRSMVNTHIKKVHLKTNKRCQRPPKYQNVYWKTKTVPIQELSIAIQDKVFNLEAGKNEISINPTG